MIRNGHCGRPGLLPVLLVIAAGMVCGCQGSDTRGGDPFHRTRHLSIAAIPELSNPLEHIKMALANDDTTLALTITYAMPNEIAWKLDSGAMFDAILTTQMTTLDTFNLHNRSFLEHWRTIAGDPLVVIVPIRSSDSAIDLPDLAASRFNLIAIPDERWKAGELALWIFEKWGLRDTLQHRLRYGMDARDVVDQVADGKAAAGIVFGSDARRFEGRVRIVQMISEPPAAATDTIPPFYIGYRAIVHRNTRDSVKAFELVEYLLSPMAQQIFNHYGFTPADSMPMKANWSVVSSQ